MAKELVSVNENLSVINCVREMRKQAKEVTRVHSIYVTNSKNKLLGRLSLRSTGELAVVVNKILGYEQASDMQNNWFEKARIVGDPSTSGISCTITAENIAEKMEDYGMQDVDLKISGGNYDDYMQDALSEGVNYLNYRGWYGVSGFGNSDVDGASSAGFRLTFATIITCGTGSFSSEEQCLSEKFLMSSLALKSSGITSSLFCNAPVASTTKFEANVNSTSQVPKSP